MMPVYTDAGTLMLDFYSLILLGFLEISVRSTQCTNNLLDFPVPIK